MTWTQKAWEEIMRERQQIRIQEKLEERSGYPVSFDCDCSIECECECDKCGCCR